MVETVKIYMSSDRNSCDWNTLNSVVGGGSVKKKKKKKPSTPK